MKKILACVSMIMLLLGTVLLAQWYQNPLIQVSESSKEMNRKVNNWAKPDEEYLEYYELGTFETELPVLYINTNGQSIQKEEKIWATMAVAEPLSDGQLRSVMSTPDYEADIMINYRGASSYSGFDKKQYRVEFFREAGSTNAKNYEFLGMGANSEWVLNGPFLDRTLLRNRLVYNLGREIFEWAPDNRYVELFVNGEYQGVYLAVEPVTNGESRLRLADFGLSSGETAYIVKRDRVDTEEGALNVYGYYAGKTSNSLYIDYPTTNNLTDVQKEWITKDISNFEEVLYGDDFADTRNGYIKYLNVDNFVDYYILNEVVMNYDAGNLSTYVYKELGGKINIAIWDYNNCYDNYQWFAEDYCEFFLQDNAWFSRLLQDRAFVDKVVKRYKELRADTLSEEYMYQQIESYRNELGAATERNFAIWGYTFHDSFLSEDTELHVDPTSYEEAIELLKKSIHKRFLFLDEHITDLYEGCVN